jgi:hypothetical protein
MAYQGLGSVYKQAGDMETLKRRGAKKRAESKGIAGNVVGIPAAAATAYFTGGDPTSTMAAYQMGKGVGEGGYEAISGDDGVSKGSMDQVLQGGVSAVAANKDMKAAEEAAKKSKELSDLLKFLQA